MNETLFPIEVRVLSLLRQRTDLAWDMRLTIDVIRDFPELDRMEVAGACALYIAQHPKVSNGPKTLRTFMENAQSTQRNLDREASRSHELSRYNRPRN